MPFTPGDRCRSEHVIFLTEQRVSCGNVSLSGTLLPHKNLTPLRPHTTKMSDERGHRMSCLREDAFCYFLDSVWALGWHRKEPISVCIQGKSFGTLATAELLCLHNRTIRFDDSFWPTHGQCHTKTCETFAWMRHIFPLLFRMYQS